MIGHAKIEIITSDVKSESIVAAILDSANTGLSGDGIVVVQPVEQVFRIRTRKEVSPEDL